jgi:hypothetical protein
MMTNYGYTCYQKIISKSSQTLSPRNIISHHIYKCLRHVPNYILAIQSNKCIPYFNINVVNCAKKYRDLRVMNLRNFLRAHQAYQKLVLIFSDHQALYWCMYTKCVNYLDPNEYDSVENTAKFGTDKSPIPNNQITHSLV